MKEYWGMLGLLLVTIIWGAGFTASDIALQSLEPFQIMAGRFLLAALLMGVAGFPRVTKITRQEWKAGTGMGVFLAFALQTVGLRYTTPSKNAFLTAANVVFVPFIAFLFYRKKVRPAEICGAILALAGVGFLSLERDLRLGLGDALTLAGAVCFAFQIVLTGKAVEKYRPMALNFVQMATACICSLAGLVCSRNVKISFTAGGVLSVLYLGAVSTALTYLLQTLSQRYVDETKAAVILSLEAVFGCLFSVLLLKEHITLRMLAGAGMILSAVLIPEIKWKRRLIGNGVGKGENGGKK